MEDVQVWQLIVIALAAVACMLVIFAFNVIHALWRITRCVVNIIKWFREFSNPTYTPPKTMGHPIGGELIDPARVEHS